MKRHVAATLLALTTLGVINAHVDVEAQDGRYFGVWQGTKHDVLGKLEDHRNRLWRNCSNVERVAPGSDVAEQVLALIRNYSPPDSQQAQLISLRQLGPWLVAELNFAQLNPAVVLLRHEGQALQLLDRAIWSGSTAPWEPGPRIRAHLQEQETQSRSTQPVSQPTQGVEQALATLLACYEPASPGLH
jgi:hypothetical protein